MQLTQDKNLAFHFRELKAQELHIDGLRISRSLKIPCTKTTVITVRILSARQNMRQKLVLDAENCVLNIGGDRMRGSNMWADKILEQKTFPEKVKADAALYIFNGWMDSGGTSQSLLYNYGMIVEKVPAPQDAVAKYLLRCNDGHTFPADFESIVAEVIVQDGLEFRPTDVVEIPR